MAIRLTQIAVETLVEPIPATRLTQIAVEALVGPVEPAVRLTQIAVEVLIAAVNGNACAQPWTMPEPNPFPFPAIGGPQYRRFQEVKPDWGNFGVEFKDKLPAHNTIQTSRIRYFEIDYDGLDQAQAAIIDTHYRSTRGGISFSVTLPRTGEVITNVRYEKFERPPHQKVWAQSRRITLVKYTN